MKKPFIALAVLFCGLVTSGVGSRAAEPMNAIGEKYAHLVLALGQHDPDYVDAFYGPAEWKTQAEKEKKSLDAIGAEAAELVKVLNQEKPSPQSSPKGRGGEGVASSSDAAATDSDLTELRREYLEKQISALAARVRMLKGEKLKFDEESRALYDAVAPTYPDSHFDGIIKQLDAKIPVKNGQSGSDLWKRYEEWRKPFAIPKDKLDAVFQAAIKECRARTLAHIALPPNESFTVEYVTSKPWGGYNWFKGNFHSVIQVNTDLPIFIDRAVDLAAHEGYPGHHVYNSLLEKNLVRDRGWMEFSVYALFAPQSLIAEGTANFGREVAFPTKAERMKFEKEVLFPAAGIDAARADEYYAVQDLMKDLNYAVNEAARRLINGEIDENAAVQWLQKYAVMEPARAQQRVKFIQKYRSYVINYNLGEDMVKRYIEKRAGNDSEKKWSEFGKLLSSPRLPSSL
ncbi:MAG TPA: hypothetical protein VH170_01190 [Chthoniobacterales bacterium]|jgi:hypothetical protein|nr:hypothetical protein [Chthoniobacterales bacterium]